MNPIEKYFRQKTNKLSYIELKDNINKYNSLGISDIPLPILLEEMVDGITTNNFDNEIKMEYIFNGILFNIAIDNEFLYINEYKDILKKAFENPSNYAMKKSVENIGKDIEKALLYSRAAFILDEKNELAAYNYASMLWGLDVSEDERHIFVEEAVRILQRILNFNNENPFANFEMGNISRSTGEYIKANSYFKRALDNTDNEELKESIRDQMQKVAPDVAVENAIYLINKMNYSSAITELMEARKNSSRYDIPYYIAISYMNQENPEMAERYFEEAIDKGADFATLYTDYIYVKYILGKDFEALQIADEAIEKYPTELKLRYNRAIINILLKRFDKANEDFDFILEYSDLSDEFFNQIMKIKHQIGE